MSKFADVLTEIEQALSLAEAAAPAVEDMIGGFLKAVGLNPAQVQSSASSAAAPAIAHNFNVADQITSTRNAVMRDNPGISVEHATVAAAAAVAAAKQPAS